MPELNSPQVDARPVPRFDGLELFFGSPRAGGFGNFDLWSATRNTVDEPWSAPVNLSVLNSAASDQQGFIAADRQTLYFASDRAGGQGGLDLYIAVRLKNGGE